MPTLANAALRRAATLLHRSGAGADLSNARQLRKLVERVPKLFVEALAYGKAHATPTWPAGSHLPNSPKTKQVLRSIIELTAKPNDELEGGAA